MGNKLAYQAPPWTGITGEKVITLPGLAVSMMDAELKAMKSPELAHLSEHEKTDLVLAVGGIASFLGRHTGSIETAKESFEQVMSNVIESLGQNG